MTQIKGGVRLEGGRCPWSTFFNISGVANRRGVHLGKTEVYLSSVVGLKLLLLLVPTVSSETQLLCDNFMNNDVTILTIHMLIILPMQHYILKFQNDVINVPGFQANLKKMLNRANHVCRQGLDVR